MSNLHQLLTGDSPDDFMTRCRDALRQIVAELPPDQARTVLHHATKPNPFTTPKQHQAWLDSHQCKAIGLEVLLKEQAADD